MRMIKKLFHFSAFLLFYVREILVSNFRVAIDVVSIRPNVTPGIIPVKLTLLNDSGITMLANFVSMTPGTLALEYDPETGELWIHSMYLDDAEAFVSGIHKQYENRISKFQ